MEFGNNIFTGIIITIVVEALAVIWVWRVIKNGSPEHNDLAKID